MMRIKTPNNDSSEFDACGNTTIAVAEYNGIHIPLCKDCLDSLRESLKEYDDTITRVYNIQSVMQWDNNTLLQAVKSWNNTINNLSNMNLKSWLQFIKYVNKQYNSNF